MSRRPRPSTAAQDRHRRPQRQPKAATGPIYPNRARTVASHGPHPLFQPQGRSASVDSGLGSQDRAQRRARVRRVALEASARGACHVCGAAAVTAKHCPRHRDLNNAAALARKLARQAAGLCRRCPWPAETRDFCRRHREMDAARQRTRYRQRDGDPHPVAAASTRRAARQPRQQGKTPAAAVPSLYGDSGTPKFDRIWKVFRLR